MPVLLFDMDGTLTEPCRPMADEMAAALIDVASRNPVYIVTGSDYAKVRAQVPASVLEVTAGVFTCSGNEMWIAGETAFAREHVFPHALLFDIRRLVKETTWRGVRASDPIEVRAGALNVAVIGHDADAETRARYAAFDASVGDRRRIAEGIRSSFKAYSVRVGGQVSLDVTPGGWDKSRVAAEVIARHPYEPIVFFADRLGNDGNDFPLAAALSAHNHTTQPVTEWHGTLRALESMGLV